MKAIHTKYITFAWLLTLSAYSISVSAQSLTFTLEQAKQYAIENSYFAQQAEKDRQMAVKQLKETTAIGLPQISAGVDYNNFLELPTSLLPAEMNPSGNGPLAVQFGTTNQLTAKAQLTQIIFNGSYIVALQAAKSYREMSEKAVVKTEREIKDMITQTYGNVIIAEENYETIKGNAEYLQITLDETQALYDAGFAEEQDVDQLTILLQTAKIQLDKADRYRAIFTNMFKFQMGINQTETVALTDSLDYIVDYGNDSSIVFQKFDVNAHIDYQIALNNAELDLMSYKNAKAEMMPDLTGFLSYQQQYQSDDMSLNSDYWFPNSVVGLKLNVPVFTSLNKTYAKQGAELKYQKSLIEAEQKQQDLMVEYLTVKTEYQFAVAQYKNQKANLELVTRIIDKETIKFQEGASSSLNLANAQIQFFEIQGAYIQSIMTMIQARSNMDKILSNY